MQVSQTSTAEAPRERERERERKSPISPRSPIFAAPSSSEIDICSESEIGEGSNIPAITRSTWGKDGGSQWGITIERIPGTLRDGHFNLPFLRAAFASCTQLRHERLIPPLLTDGLKRPRLIFACPLGHARAGDRVFAQTMRGNYEFQESRICTALSLSLSLSLSRARAHTRPPSFHESRTREISVSYFRSAAVARIVSACPAFAEILPCRFQFSRIGQKRQEGAIGVSINQIACY